MKKILLAVFLFSLNAFAATDETILRFQVQDKSDIRFITKIVSIDAVSGLTVTAYANRDELSRFEKLNIPYEVLPTPSELITPRMFDEAQRGVSEWNAYPTYEAYEKMMFDCESKYPKLCKIYDIGKSVRGRRLLVAKLSSHVEVEAADKPEFFYSSSMHGDETTGYVLMLRLMDHLLSNSSTDARVKKILDQTEIWISPLANPDATYWKGNQTVQGARRYNANNVDLNRNYPDPEDGEHPDNQTWQPETVAMMDFSKTRNFVMGANFHGGAEVVNYVWDTWAKRHPDDAWVQKVSHDYADTVHKVSSSYMGGFNRGIINGYDWYEVNGGRQDFMNYFRNCRELTIELSNIKLVAGSELPAFWNYNQEAFLGLVEQTLYGIRGLVVDKKTKTPIVARIDIEGLEADNAFVMSKAKVGAFFKPLLAGTYTVKVNAPGYKPYRGAPVSVLSGQSTKVRVELEPLRH